MGAADEPVDFARTIASHGVAELPPNRLELAERTFETTIPVPRGARTVQVRENRGKLRVEAITGTLHPKLAQTLAHMFRLDEDLSRFYGLVVEDDLAWVRGRRQPHAARADGVRGRRQDKVSAHTNVNSGRSYGFARHSQRGPFDLRFPGEPI